VPRLIATVREIVVTNDDRMANHTHEFGVSLVTRRSARTREPEEPPPRIRRPFPPPAEPPRPVRRPESFKEFLRGGREPVAVK